jgi:hypothetical protein
MDERDLFSARPQGAWNQQAQDWGRTQGPPAQQGWGQQPAEPQQAAPGDWYATVVDHSVQQGPAVEEREAALRSRFPFMGRLLMRYWPERIRYYREVCEAVGFFAFADDWVLVSSIAAVVALVASFPVLTGLSDAAIVSALPVAVGVGVGFVLLYLPVFTFEKRRDEIETNLPDALFQAASNPPRTHIVELLSGLVSIGYGPLSDELAVTVTEIEKGASVKDALEHLSARNHSKVVDRACYLLIRAQEQGVDIVDALAALATDIKETKYLLRERAASLQLQKITLLASGGALVPLILGLVVGLATAMGRFSEEKAAAIGAQVAMVQPVFFGYVIIHALLACMAIGRQEGDIKKSVYYVLPVTFLAVALYNYVAPRIMLMFMG